MTKPQEANLVTLILFFVLMFGIYYLFDKQDELPKFNQTCLRC